MPGERRVRLLARYAESLFWLARYTERAASLARVIEMHTAFGRGLKDDPGWAWIVTLHSDEKRFAERYEAATADNVIRFYVRDLENPGSIRSVMRAARENARALRPYMPTEIWTQLNEFHNWLLGIGEADLDAVRLSRTCALIRNGCHAQIGVAESTLYRDEGLRFYRLGLLIERADQTSRLLDVKFAQLATGTAAEAPAADFVFWSTLLRSASAYQPFRRFEPRGADPGRVARFLVLNASLPRSIAYCAGEIRSALHELRTGHHLPRTTRALEQVEIFCEGLEAASRDARLIERLHDFNDWVQRRLMVLSDELGTAFFGYPPPQAQPAAASAGQAQLSA
jgi:uncharacterized alpha-E superfamily protein